MGRLKSRLSKLLTEPFVQNAKRSDYSEDIALRKQIKGTFELPIARFCRERAQFDYCHGLVYKLLRTNVQRLNNSTLVCHDMMFWLRNHGKAIPALWVVRLAGPKTGAVARNQLLTWLRKEGKITEMHTVYSATRKWGFVDTDRTASIVAAPRSVSEARALYAHAKMSTPTARRILGNTLLKQVAAAGDPAEVLAFFRCLNKDIVTFQTIIGAMVTNAGLRVHLSELWELAQRQDINNNINIDDKLRETYERVRKLQDSAASQHQDSSLH